MDLLEIRTNAKLNLYLSVGARRCDGFHGLETVFHSVSLADELTFERLDGAKVRGTTSGAVIDASDNLVGRAAKLLQERTGTRHGAAIELVKRIPIGGGLAGGSGNAAGTLVALNELWELSLSREQLIELALELGSDVPYCVRGGTCLATGRGEVLESLQEPAPLWFVLGISNDPLSTAAVYGAYEAADSAPPVRELTRALEAGGLDAISAALHNDLETPAMTLRPELAQKKEVLLDAGALRSLISGSGPTVLGLCQDEMAAQEVAGQAAMHFDRIEVVSSRPSIVEQS